MTQQNNQNQKKEGNQTQSKQMSWRKKYRPFTLAFIVAAVMTMLVFPEVNEGKGMVEAIKDGDVLVVQKSSYSAKRGAPKKNDVVVLEKKYSKTISQDNLILRVVALPGEKIEIKDPKTGESKKIKVSKDNIYLEQDNGDGSMDSRNSKLGTVPLKEIKGKVLWKIWPLSQFGGIN